MILIDTGPLVALLNRNDPSHPACVSAMQNIASESLVTTLPCFTEAIHFMGKVGEYSAQARLWALRNTGNFRIHSSSEAEMDRMEVLMARYADAPMDLADASLVAAAESLNLAQILTLDKHFYAYRMRNTTQFSILI